MTTLQKMSKFVAGLRLSDVPTEVETAARRHLADTLACGIGAYDQPPVRSLIQYARRVAGVGRSAIFGYGDKTSPAMASLVNGTMVRYLDANDISSFGGGHFSDGVPPLLALAQDRRRSANDLVTAIVGLYEIQGVLAQSFDFMSRGYHALTQIPWTTPMVAANMIGANRYEAVHAAGLSGATGMVLNTWLKPAESIPSIKAVAVGLAGQRAVECAELAALGVTASDDALEYAMSTLDRSYEPDTAASALAELGSSWTMLRHVIKSYPSQIYTQAAVQAALALRDSVESVEEIASITVFGHRNVCSGVQGSPSAFRPRSREAADHSTPFVMAMALLNGEVTRKTFEGEAWLRADVLAVMDRIRLIVDPERDRAFVEDGVFGVRLEAELRGGRSEAVEVIQPKGHPDDPLTDNELIAKMSWLLDGIVNDRVPADLFDVCMNMTTESDIDRLTDLCTVGTT